MKNVHLLGNALGLYDWLVDWFTVFLYVVSEMADCLVLLDMINKLHSFLMMLNSVASITCKKFAFKLSDV